MAITRGVVQSHMTVARCVVQGHMHGHHKGCGPESHAWPSQGVWSRVTCMAITRGVVQSHMTVARCVVQGHTHGHHKGCGPESHAWPSQGVWSRVTRMAITTGLVQSHMTHTMSCNHHNYWLYLKMVLDRTETLQQYTTRFCALKTDGTICAFELPNKQTIPTVLGVKDCMVVRDSDHHITMS